MAALQDRRERLLDSLYATYGVDANWELAAGGAAVPLTIRRRTETADGAIGSGRVLVDAEVIRVRRAELTAPSAGDLVEDVGAGETLKVLGEPRRSHSGLEWVCEVAVVQAP